MLFGDAHKVPATFLMAQDTSPRGSHTVQCVKTEVNWCNCEGDGYILSRFWKAQLGIIDQGESIANVETLHHVE
jgi:hypothetical protein